MYTNVYITIDWYFYRQPVLFLIYISFGKWSSPISKRNSSKGMFREYSHETIAKELEIDISVVKKVEHMVKKSEHKRNMPPILEI